MVLLLLRTCTCSLRPCSRALSLPCLQHLYPLPKGSLRPITLWAWLAPSLWERPAALVKAFHGCSIVRVNSQGPFTPLSSSTGEMGRCLRNLLLISLMLQEIYTMNKWPWGPSAFLKETTLQRRDTLVYSGACSAGTRCLHLPPTKSNSLTVLREQEAWTPLAGGPTRKRETFLIFKQPTTCRLRIPILPIFFNVKRLAISLSHFCFP